MSFFSNPFFETGQEPIPITEIECSSKKLEKDANANPKYIFPIVTIQTKVNNIILLTLINHHFLKYVCSCQYAEGNKNRP